jgi:hypothetical protein
MTVGMAVLTNERRCRIDPEMFNPNEPRLPNSLHIHRSHQRTERSQRAKRLGGGAVAVVVVTCDLFGRSIFH